MEGLREPMVDVRDMLCAQALAVVAQAVQRLRHERAVEVAYNAQDVKHDLLVWARERRYPASESGPSTLRIVRGGASPG